MKIFILTDEEKIDQGLENTSLSRPIPFSQDWEISMIDVKGKLVHNRKTKALPILAREFPTFSGTITYRTNFQLEKIGVCCLTIERVFDGAVVYLNGQKVDTLIAPPYQLLLESQLRVGQNELVIEVPTTADRQLADATLLLNQFEPMEPIGMIGEVPLFQKE
ncbi:hypothetical protein BN1356_00533 [Streptococcus varani]|uniref:Beta-galactosidase/beta-glucuronidase n=2 Tax=Streptococcus varani TaxID=1608583 RepID=A0A0E4H3W1_9STRE|nr:hypothetical protein BN1356_00533 [Streptococcus varani]